MKRIAFPTTVLVFIILACARGGGLPGGDTLLVSRHADTSVSRLANQAFLSVETSAPGLMVMVDTISIGPSPIMNLSVTAGFHVVHVSSKDPSWFEPVVQETLTVRPGESILRHIAVPMVYHITSNPYGANVFLRDSLVGTTPLLLTTNAPGSVIKVGKSGFSEKLVPLPPGSSEVPLTLQAASGLGGDQQNFLSDRSEKNLTPIYLSAGMAVVTGAASAYFKIKADSFFSDYQSSGNEATLNQVHRYDRAAAVTLVASQASIMLLTYLLLSH